MQKVVLNLSSSLIPSCQNPTLRSNLEKNIFLSKISKKCLSVWDLEFIISKKGVDRHVINNELQFSSYLFTGFVDIKYFICPWGVCCFNKDFLL